MPFIGKGRGSQGGLGGPAIASRGEADENPPPGLLGRKWELRGRDFKSP